MTALRVIGLALLATATLVAPACDDSSGNAGSETHWLRACDVDTTCGNALKCVCGTCTLPCAKSSECATLGSSATCAAPAAVAAACDGVAAPSASLCLSACTTTAGCSIGSACLAGACIPNVVVSRDAGTDASGNGVSTGGSVGSGGASGGSGGSGGGSHEAGTGDSGSDAGTPDASAVATYNDPCSAVGSGACLGHGQTRQLVCDGTKWVANGSCTTGTLCDTTPGANAGACQPIVAECKAATPGNVVCQGQNRVTCGPDLVTTISVNTCTNQACVTGACSGVCAPASKQCSGNGVQTCNDAGAWGATSLCTNHACVNGACIGVCAPGVTLCSGNGVETCGADGQWSSAVPCSSQACLNGACSGTCTPAAKQCSGNGVQTCDSSGIWGTVAPCTDQACVVGACVGVCAPAAKKCSNNDVQVCGADGQWATQSTCSGTEICQAGACVVGPPSCVGLPATCGPQTNETCCVSLPVTGGTFFRDVDNVTYTDRGNPATISNFRFDRFEATVGRFRKFVAAWNGGWRPAAGAGKHTHLNGGQGLAAVGGGYEPGWDTAWASNIPTTPAAWDSTLACHSMYQTWTSSPAGNETRPINCTTGYEAIAFCIWDGGFIPSEAEWNYAAAGGNEQRVYPWSVPPTSSVIDDSYVVFCGASCNSNQNVGSKSPKGDGKFGQADLAGNQWEWTLDVWHRTVANPCVDCVQLSPTTQPPESACAPPCKAARGENFQANATQVYSSYRNVAYLGVNYNEFDITPRCARAP